MGFFAKLKEGLKKTRAIFTRNVDDLVENTEVIDDDFYDSLLDILILADCGADVAEDVIARLRERVKKERIKSASDAREVLKELLVSEMDIPQPVMKWPVVMLIVGVNYSFMMQEYPDAGGAFSYIKGTFGYDHGFVGAWFLLLTYTAIVWANATALPLIGRFLLGDVFQFGFTYSIAGFHVYFGELLLACGALIVCGLLCAHGRAAVLVQLVMALVLCGGVLLCSVAVFKGLDGGLASITPAFAPGRSRLTGVFTFIAMGPWAFIGFESITQESQTYIHKGVNRVDGYIDLMKRLHDNGILVQGCFAFGGDEEDTSVFERTVETVIKAKIDLPRYSILTPFPRTELYAQLEREGRITERNWAMYDVQHCVFEPKKMTKEQLEEGTDLAWRLTYSTGNIMKRLAPLRHSPWLSIPLNLGYKGYADKWHKFTREVMCDNSDIPPAAEI